MSTVRAMLIEESLAALDEVLAEDKTPGAAEIRIECRAKLERETDWRAAIAYLEQLTARDGADAARARWRATVRRGIRREIADLRPS